MIPLRDENPTRTTPVVTIVLIAACVVIYFFVQPRDEGVEDAVFTLETAAIPCEVVRGRPLSRDEVEDTYQEGDTTACEADPLTPPFAPGKNVYLAILYSMFLHANLLHLGGNMLYLWIFGNNIEDARGHLTYLAFYLLSGLVATAAHIAVQPASTLPMIGASGAVAGVMGAYLVLHPNAPIRTLLIFGFIVLIRDVPASLLLAIWFILQFFTAPGSDVAWVAHVGGFVFGVLAGLLWKAGSRGQPLPAPWRPSY